MRRKNIAVVGMLLVTCLSSVGCGQKKDKQESLAATKTSAFETASEKQTEEKTEKETIKETSKETVKETETETEKETESKTEADTKTAVSESDELADGVYTADFNTDSSMFHVNEAKDGKGVFFSTHITSDLDKIADMLIMIDSGQIVFQEEKDQLLDSYRIIKGSAEKLNSDTRKMFLCTEESAFNFTGITKQASVVMECMQDVLIERPTIEDIMLANVERRKKNVI